MTSVQTETGVQTGAVREIEAATLRGWLESGRAELIDVRESDERVRERIEPSRSAPLSGFDPAAVRPAGGDRTLVLHCRSGRRSAEAVARLAGAGYTGVHHLKGGIEAWKAAGFPVQGDAKAPISIMRQVQITVGSAVLAGVGLGVWVSPWFLLIPAFMGAGLLVAGTTGTCGLAAVLSRMPWNRVFRCAGSGSAAAGRV